MLAAALFQAPPSLAMIAHARAEFEIRLHEPYNHHVACMMMNAGNTAYFPVGVATRRYLLQVIQAEPHLLFQAMRGKRARTVWSLALEERRGPEPKSGTLRRMLWNQGYRLASRRLGRSARAALEVTKPFAFYTAYGPDAWIEAGLLRADGKEGAWDAYFSYPGAKPEGRPLFFPIVADEAVALGLPAERWHGPGPLAFAHILAGHDVADAKVERVP